MNLLELPLPRVIFLAGSTLSVRRRLSNGLSDIRPEVMELSFDEPIRNGTLGTFFCCDPNLELMEDNKKLPGLGDTTNSLFRFQFRNFLISVYGAGVLGRIMSERLIGNKDYFDTFIFEDGDEIHNDDIAAIARAVGETNCIYVYVGTESIPEPKLSWLQVPLDTTPEKLLTAVSYCIEPQAVEGTPE